MNVLVETEGHYAGWQSCSHYWMSVWNRPRVVWCPKCGAEGVEHHRLVVPFLRGARTVLRRLARFLGVSGGV